jgi:hypothetical protein
MSPKRAVVNFPEKKNQASPPKHKKLPFKAVKFGKDPTKNPRHHDLRLQ